MIGPVLAAQYPGPWRFSDVLLHLGNSVRDESLALTETATGNGNEAKTLADNMSLAWVAFAKSVSPNISGLPDWLLYDRDSGAAMVFDDHPVLKSNHDLALMQLLDPDGDI